jgi:hypothetical protein
MADFSPEGTAPTASSQQTTELAPAKFHFELLPPELRNLIYHELWKFTPKVRGRCNAIASQLVFLSTATEPYLGWEDIGVCSFPSWLRTCKLILHEGLEELVRLSLGSVGLWQLPSRGFLYWRPNLLNPTVDERLIIWAEGLQYNPRSKGCATFTVGEPDRVRIDALDIPHTVRNLRLKIKMRPCCRYCFEGHVQMGWRLDLSPIERVVPRVEGFELEVCFLFSSFAMDWSACRASFSSEIERFAGLWVGEGGALSIKVIPGPDRQYETVLYAFRAIRE